MKVRELLEELESCDLEMEIKVQRDGDDQGEADIRAVETADFQTHYIIVAGND